MEKRLKQALGLKEAVKCQMMSLFLAILTTTSGQRYISMTMKDFRRSRKRSRLRPLKRDILSERLLKNRCRSAARSNYRKDSTTAKWTTS
jgi:hypothetical protein